MKNYSKTALIAILTTISIFGIASLVSVFAATSPALNSAWTFAILSSTYTNTTSTTVNGDIWYTTAPATPPTLVGSVHMADSLYNQAGIDQGTTLTDLNNQVCTFTFAPWAIDLATDTTHSWAIWVYTPWVYCITWAATIWWTWITLDWAGTYIFRINWALNTVDGSVITLSGSSNCDVFWTPTAATTLGANTTFNWIIIDAAGITMWANTTFLWKALAYGGTITTDTDTITAPICSSSSPATLHIIKNVVNWTAIASDFTLHVKYPLGSDVIGSPATGTWTPGTTYSLSAWNYIVSENANTSYTQSFAWDCNTSGNVSLLAGDNKTCTITNTYITPVISWGGGGGGWSTIDSCPEWDYSYSYYDKICWTAPIVESTWTILTTTSTWTTLTTTSTWTTLIINPPVKPKVTSQIITPPIIQIVPEIKTTVNDNINAKKVVTPGFPNTWIHSDNNNNPWNIIIIIWFIGIFVFISKSLVLNYKK